MDPKTKHHIRGTFYEVLPYYASAYRGEFLGLTAFHLVALAIDDLYGGIASPNNIYCDNDDRALVKAKLHRDPLKSLSTSTFMTIQMTSIGGMNSLYWRS